MAPIAQTASPIRLAAGRMTAAFDPLSGALLSLTETDGRFGTNYIGSPETSPGTTPADPFWTGNVVSTIWELDAVERPLVLIPSFSFRPSGAWREEWTGRSADIRRVALDGQTLRVDYVGRSANEGGLRSYDLRTSWRFDPDGALVYDLEAINTTGRVLEIGEFGFPLAVNDNYHSIRTVNPYTNTVDDHEILYEDERVKLTEQPLIHEQRVTAHHFVGGHSSYTLVQRLLGDPPFLLVHPAGDTAFECQYRFEDSGSVRGGRARPTVLAAHSWAVKNRRGWRAPWVNGHTSLVLQPGERRAFRLRFAFVDGYDAVRDEIARAGNLGVRVLPSMVVPQDDPVRVELRAAAEPDIAFLSDQGRVLDRTRRDGRTLLTLAFRGRGQKTVRVTWGDGRWTNLHFYCTESTAALLKARARFIAERQFYENPGDPYGRHHMFLPFDDRTGSRFADSDEVWEVGGSDEYGFADPLFLAEKNAFYPDRLEVERLEAYVDDCLMKSIQSQETFALRASLYWKERYPSSPWGHWTEKRSKESYRTYNYPHVANIYHSLYRIGQHYGLTKRPHPEYLRLAYRTCMAWFRTGPWRHVGVMGGSNAVAILEDLDREGWTAEAKSLRAELAACNDVFVNTPYPYSSELYVDQTAHEHVGMFTRAFGTPEKYRKTLQVIQALRGGNQPAWFKYGNDNRGDGAAWYTTGLNAIPLLKGYEDTGDPDMLLKGYAGAMLVTVNMRSDGMGFGRFLTSPGAFTFDPPKTYDGGLGLYGYLKAAKAYVLTDEAFGLIGCGAAVERTGSGAVRAVPTDGLRKRLRFVDGGLDLEALAGELAAVEWDAKSGRLEIEMTDSTGLIRNVALTIRGLAGGPYAVSYGGERTVETTEGDLTLRFPFRAGSRIVLEKMPAK